VLWLWGGIDLQPREMHDSTKHMYIWETSTDINKWEEQPRTNETIVANYQNKFYLGGEERGLFDVWLLVIDVTVAA